MKKVIFIIYLYSVCLTAMGQDTCILETMFRNPIDTAKFHLRPSLLLFSHPKCKNATLCTTLLMQRALEKDSLNIRKDRDIKLYVIQPFGYDKNDINDFESFEPVNSELLFYINIGFRGSFSEPNLTPFIILYDGKGNVFTKTGGSYSELCDMIRKVMPINDSKQ